MAFPGRARTGDDNGLPAARRTRHGQGMETGQAAGPGSQATISVRRAGPAEWAALRQVRLAALADSPAAFASTLKREQEFDEAEWRRRAEATPCFLAWDGPEPV